jgi:hypothetical protein
MQRMRRQRKLRKSLSQAVRAGDNSQKPLLHNIASEVGRKKGLFGLAQTTAPCYRRCLVCCLLNQNHLRQEDDDGYTPLKLAAAMGSLHMFEHLFLKRMKFQSFPPPPSTHSLSFSLLRCAFLLLDREPTVQPRDQVVLGSCKVLQIVP